jgi:hypothetical protein
MRSDRPNQSNVIRPAPHHFPAAGDDPKANHVTAVGLAMTKFRQTFRICYFGRSGSLHDVEASARDITTAIRTAREAEWPTNAIGFCLVDMEGREVFEELRADHR